MMRYKHIIPSFLSFLRVLFAACLPFYQERYWLFFIAAAALSDFLDGWLARKWHVESWQGGLIDAAADKVFILVTLSVFVVADKFSLWWIFPVIVRDIMVAVTVMYAVFKREWDAFKDMDARVSGKLTTCGQFILFGVVLLFPEKTFYVLILASCFSIAAGLDYGRLFYQALRKQS
jgi:CDP-diacylglycerol---glycerol-3-phosphate 3-phosphatidyltransferase